MKTLIFLLLSSTSVISVCSQNRVKDEIILMYDNKNDDFKEKFNLYKIDNEDFKLSKNEPNKKYALFKDISKKIITVEELKEKTKVRLKNNRIKDNFFQLYFEKYFDVWVYVENQKCQNEGILYRVEWVLAIVKPEVN